MSVPYYNVTVPGQISLEPQHMNNNIIHNIQTEAVRKYGGKCYENVGYIDEVVNIVNIKGGGVRTEDPSAAAIYAFGIECRMLVPTANMEIYATITGINGEVIMTQFGHLKIIVSTQNINEDKIRYMRNAFYPVDSNGRKKGEAIVNGTPVIVKILSSQIVPKQREIIALGYLESVATVEEYESALRDGDRSSGKNAEEDNIDDE